MFSAGSGRWPRASARGRSGQPGQAPLESAPERVSVSGGHWSRDATSRAGRRALLSWCMPVSGQHALIWRRAGRPESMSVGEGNPAPPEPHGWLVALARTGVAKGTDRDSGPGSAFPGRWGLRRSTESGAQSFPMEGKWWSNDMANSGSSTAVARTRSVTTSTSHWRRQSTPKPFRHNTRIRFTTPPGFDAWQTNSRKSRRRHRISRPGRGRPAGASGSPLRGVRTPG